MASTLQRIGYRRASYVVRVVVVFAAYLVAGTFGLLLGAVGGFASLVWPAAGIALAALLVFGLELWVAVALGAFLVNLWAGAPVLAACGMAFGNTLGAVLATVALKRLSGFGPSLERTRDVGALVVLGALPGSAVSAAIGTLSLFLGGTLPAALAVDTARAWFLGDALGDLVTAPLLLTWGSAVGHEVERKPLFEMIAAGICLVVVGGLLFLGPSAVLRASPFGAPYLVFPLLIWPAFRFGPRGATAATFAVSALSITGTVLGRGPFVSATLPESLTFLQVYMVTVTLTCLVLAAAACERAAAIRRDLRRKEVLSHVSHDLGSPLQAVRIISGMMLKALPMDEAGESRRRLEVLQRSTEQMRGLVRDLLDLNAIDADVLALQTESYEADALLREAQEQTGPLAAEKSEILDVQPVEALRVSCDHHRILQVFSNLIGNAIKFTPPGGTITIRCSGAEHFACFSVTDTGPGIAAADLPLVFEPFYRASATARSGNGLGLSIAKGIVEAHGGTIWAKSPPGQGATFYFTVPLASGS